ncbi:MAG: CHAP domain-containing protein [Sulfurospirillaceae bacterium]|nr:CHAP domain-containing protein [Sulfurospirillaceae bacterium]MDD2825786.1 CHAP domain-containing protein [Sulfurospirillaceae bacterium]
MLYHLFLFLISIFLFSGCAQKEVTPIPPQPVEVIIDDTPQRNAIVQKALKHLNKQDGGDCSGFVALVNKESEGAFYNAEELTNFYEDSRRSLAVYNLLNDQNRTFDNNPKVGDLIFFANTVKHYSKNKAVDNITHIGIVTHVDSDETVHFIHNTRGRNKIGYLNLNYPTSPLHEGKTVNSYMEKCRINSHLCLAPSYFSAYGSIR